MTPLTPMRTLPKSADLSSDDSLVIFGELFSRGYANGLVEAAEKKGMAVWYSTVGRRDQQGPLRPLNQAELIEAPKNIINIPLEAGFDLTKDSKGKTPCDQLAGLKLKEWQTAKIQWDSVEESCSLAREEFRARVKKWALKVSEIANPSKRLIIAHTMAGGVPRAKIIMPAMNRVFKGFGDRYASSEEFWNSDLGHLCNKNFMEVTEKTFEILLEETADLRTKFAESGGSINYTAYGYHGTEILIKDQYQWQSYSPYLQGFAKIQLENIAIEWWKKGVKATVFNAPEILTNSSGVFLGIEVPLYPLLLAMKKESSENRIMNDLLKELKTYFIEDFDESHLEDFAISYFNSEIIKKWSDFEAWPQHNDPKQMDALKAASQKLFSMQKDIKNPVTTPLSEIVFESCGQIMIDEAANPREPVWWLGHDIVSQQKLRLLNMAD